MHKFLGRPALASLLGTLLAMPATAEEPAKTLTPNDIVQAAPTADWVRIASSDLVVMDLAPDARGRARRVVIQLMPAPFSQGWVENIRKLVAARWYDGIAVVRVQDNYVVQWGDPDGEDPKKAKPLPGGLNTSGFVDYIQARKPNVGKYVWNSAGRMLADNQVMIRTDNPFNPPPSFADAYWPVYGFVAGFPVAVALGGSMPSATSHARQWPDAAWPIHCYGMVGVGRNLAPDTGSGAELYTVIGTPPRQLDRNIALVGRVISGIEHLSALPRGTGPLGFYETPAERVPIVSVRMGNEVTDLPGYEYLSTESASFAAYADKRANRQDEFYIRPAGGVDICNVPVPVRAVGGAIKRVGM